MTKSIPLWPAIVISLIRIISEKYKRNVYYTFYWFITDYSVMYMKSLYTCNKISDQSNQLFSPNTW